MHDEMENGDMIDSDIANRGVEAQFKSGADLQEGISGRKSIDTSFENTSQDEIDAPRSGKYAPERVDEHHSSHNSSYGGY